MILTCVSCAKPIDTDPPPCPACGRRQPDPGRESAVRVGRLAAFLGVFGLLGAICGAELRIDWVRSNSVKQHPQPERDAQRALVRETVARLRADSAAPYADLEDVLLEPERFRGKTVSVMAFLFSVKTPGAVAGRLMGGWGNGATLHIDLSRLPESRRTEAVGWLVNPSLVIARGTPTVGPEPVLQLESLELVAERRHGIETVPEMLAD